MKCAAVIAEYNPFHNGHLYHISKIREQLGEDVAIIAVMSGNYTQRGEAAIMDKWARARAATLCGVNLVLELPFPYSLSSAEYFARAGVHIANALGIVDHLSFGSESGCLSELEMAAENMMSKKFSDTFSELAKSPEYQSAGYAKSREDAYRLAFGGEPPKSSANNILAMEYVKAIKSFGSSIVPHTVKRAGAAYNDDKIGDAPFQSATAIRAELSNNGDSAYDYIPNFVKEAIIDEMDSGAFPSDGARLDAAVISQLRLISSDPVKHIHDAGGGLYNRLIDKAREASDISTLIELSSTKKYTTARIRRAIWYSFFGVTSSDVKMLPDYTQVLAMDKIGKALLKEIKKTSGIEILTKPSTTPQSCTAARQKALSDRADMIYQLTLPTPRPGSSIYKRTPFINEA